MDLENLRRRQEEVFKGDDSRLGQIKEALDESEAMEEKVEKDLVDLFEGLLEKWIIQ